MKIAILFTLIALHLSLTYTASKGWVHHEEWRGDRYDCLAHSILQGRYADCNGYNPTAYRLPGYPVALAGLFVAFGGSESAVRLLQSVIAAMIVFVAVAFTQRLGGIGVVSGIGVVLSRPLYETAALLQTDLLFAFLVLLFVVVTVNRHYRTAGLLLGVALLTRGTLLFALPLLPFVVQPRYWLRFTLPALAIIGMWTARNAIAFHSFVPFSTGSGAVLYGADNAKTFAQSQGNWLNPPILPGWAQFEGMGAIEQDHALTASALSYIRNIPVSLLVSNTLAKIKALFGMFEGTNYQWPTIVCLCAAVVRLLSLSLSSRRRLRTQRYSGATTAASDSR